MKILQKGWKDYKVQVSNFPSEPIPLQPTLASIPQISRVRELHSPLLLEWLVEPSGLRLLHKFAFSAFREYICECDSLMEQRRQLSSRYIVVLVGANLS